MFGTRSSVSHTSPLTPSSPSPYTSTHTYKKTLYVSAPYRRCHTQRPGQSSMMPRQIVSFAQRPLFATIHKPHRRVLTLPAMCMLFSCFDVGDVRPKCTSRAMWTGETRCLPNVSTKRAQFVNTHAESMQRVWFSSNELRCNKCTGL